MLRKITVGLALVGSLFTGTLALADGYSSTAPLTPDQALSKLMSGNRKYLAGDLEHIKDMTKSSVRIDNAVNGQKPFAIVLSCADSRVPVEEIFDKGIGEIFVARVAGNIAPEETLGSIEYGVEHLGAPLIMVLGHSKCGAVGATYAAHLTPPTAAELEAMGHIVSLVKEIDPAVTAALAENPAAGVEECVVENVNLVAEKIEKQSKIVEEAIAAGKLKIVKAKYDISTGVVSLLP